MRKTDTPLIEMSGFHPFRNFRCQRTASDSKGKDNLCRSATLWIARLGGFDDETARSLVCGLRSDLDVSTVSRVKEGFSVLSTHRRGCNPFFPVIIA